MKMSSATFLLLGKLPTPSDYAARAKSSFTAVTGAEKSTKVTLASALSFASITFVRDNRAYIRTISFNLNKPIDPNSTPSGVY